MSLSAKQRAAATRTGQDVCVVAGPGSGKTRVLIQRFAWLVRERRIAPGRILAITFTEKAATEIKKRLVTEFSRDEAVREQMERAYVSTVHGFCARLLKENAIAAGVDPGFAVFQGPDAIEELKDVIETVLDGLFAEQPEGMRGLLEAVYVPTFGGGFAPDLAGSLEDVYEALRIAGVDLAAGEPFPLPAGRHTPELRRMVDEILAEGPVKGTENQERAHATLLDWCRRMRPVLDTAPTAEHFRLLAELNVNAGHLKKATLSRGNTKAIKDEVRGRVQSEWVGGYYARERELLVEALRRIDALYRERKRARSLLDFGDLEESAIHLLTGHTEVREAVRQSFDQILMDELQDTNPLQWRLIDLLRRPNNFFAVGDINQSIYGFRHADPSVFRRYQEQLADAGRAVDRLDDNYRSRAPVLEAVERVLGDAPGIAANPLNSQGLFQEKGEPSVELLAGEAEETAEAAAIEASWVARRIRELEGSLAIGPPGAERPVQFSDIAILGRTIAGLEPVRAALDAFGIPSLLMGGKTFFETREVRDLVQWLQVLSNARDEVALAGVLRSPLVGVADETILRIRRRGESLCDSVEQAVVGNPFGCDAAELEKLTWFEELFTRQRRVRDYRPPDQLLAELIDESGYEEALTAAGRRNVEKLLTLLGERAANSPRPLAELLEELAAARGAGSEPEAPPDNSANAVKLMSMHAAKGLEFPVVFLPSLHKDTSNRQPRIVYSPGAGLGVGWRDPSDGGRGIGDAAREAFTDEVRDREAEEENRLLYVAMTRAGEHLVLSYSARRENGRPSAVCKRVAERLAGIEARRQERAVNDFPPVAEARGEERVVERAQAAGQFDSILTVTALAAFRQCPRRYYLSRYLGFDGAAAGPLWSASGEEPEPATGDRASVGATALGSEVHALLALEPVENPGQEALRLAEAFRASELGQRAARATRAEREFDVLMAVDDVVVRGSIDLWFEEAGELILIDYKTDRGKSGASAGGQYAVQLRLYALALERITGRLPDLAALFLLRTGEVVPISLSEADLQDARAAVEALKQAQETLAFPVQPGEHCMRCGHFGQLCPVTEVAAG